LLPAQGSGRYSGVHVIFRDAHEIPRLTRFFAGGFQFARKPGASAPGRAVPAHTTERAGNGHRLFIAGNSRIARNAVVGLRASERVRTKPGPRRGQSVVQGAPAQFFDSNHHPPDFVSKSTVTCLGVPTYAWTLHLRTARGPEGVG